MPGAVIALYLVVQRLEIGNEPAVGGIDGFFDGGPRFQRDALLLIFRKVGFLHLVQQRLHQDAFLDWRRDEVAHLLQHLRHHELRGMDFQLFPLVQAFQDLVELDADGIETADIILGVTDRVHLVRGFHERRKAALHAEHLVHREAVEAVLLPFHNRAQHGGGYALRHQVGIAGILVLVSEQDTVGLLQMRQEAVACSEALVVKLRIVAGNPQRLEHAQAAEHLGALEHDLQHGPAEKQVDVDRLEVPGVGQEQAAGDDDNSQQDAHKFEYFSQHEGISSGSLKGSA